MIKQFRITFGNRIMNQIERYIPVYISCGGSELEGLDDILSKKVMRKTLFAVIHKLARNGRYYKFVAARVYNTAQHKPEDYYQRRNNAYGDRAYISCGGSELEGLDDILSKKVMRKLGMQNPVYMRNFITPPSISPKIIISAAIMPMATEPTM